MSTAAAAAAAAGDVNWHATGEGLLLPTARRVAMLNAVPLDVLLKGLHVPPGVKDCLASAEDHVVVKDGAHHVIKFADYSRFTDVCVPAHRDGMPHRDLIVGVHTAALNVVIMPYADLASCKKMDALSRAATPQLHGYHRVEIANRDLLIRKLRVMAAVDDEAKRVRCLESQIKSLCRGLFPPNKYPRSSAAWPRSSSDRRIAMDRLMKAHLDAKQYGDAHDQLLHHYQVKHDAMFTFYDPCRGPGDDSPEDLAKKKKGMESRLEEYRRELEGMFGTAPLDQWAERAAVLRMEAQCEFDTDLVNERMKAIGIAETAVEGLDFIADKLLLITGAQPSLLGSGV